MNKLLNPVESAGYELARDDVHVWSASLDRPTAIFYGWLSIDEIRRADRFHFERDRNRFIVCHGILRKILSGYLDTRPGRLQVCYGKNNKPSVVNGSDKYKLHFSLSHSEGIALYGLTLNREIGVDIEYMRDVPEMEKLAERFFSPRENEVLHILSESRRQQAFFNCWTRKEAFVKATGDGLSYPLDKFEVSMVPDEPARLIYIQGDSDAAARWSIRDLRPVDGYAAALAMQGRVRNVCYREWAG
jgi:4'-phosphopantetheinyl transferase